VQVIGHNHHRINNKWMCRFDTAHRFSQHIDMLHQQTAFSLGKINRKKIARTR